MALPSCPYCRVELAKTPGRKKRCPHCGNTIYVKRRPDRPEKELMTAAEAEQVERVWHRRSCIQIARERLQSVGLGDAPELALLELGVGDPDEVAERQIMLAAESASEIRHRKMAWHLLAMMAAERGDEAFREHLRNACLCELLDIQARGFTVVEIIPGWNDRYQVCARARRDLPIDDALRLMPIPNRFCPAGRGEIKRGYCSCHYAVSLEDPRLKHLSIDATARLPQAKKQHS